jgi:hypothetical protein
MRRPPPPSVPSRGKEKKRNTPICHNWTTASTVHTGGIVLSFNAPLSISLYRMQNFNMQQQLHCAFVPQHRLTAGMHALLAKTRPVFFLKKKKLRS